MSYLTNYKIVYKNGEVLSWILEKDGRSFSIDIEISILRTPDGYAVTLGGKTQLPFEVEVYSHNQLVLFHGKQLWMRQDYLSIVCGDLPSYLIFEVEEISEETVTLYFPAYLPAGISGGGVIVYDERQNLESTPHNDSV